MSARSLGLAPFFSIVFLAACSSTPDQDAPPPPPAYGVGGSAQLFSNLGTHTRKVSTTSPEAQLYFDEGLNWAYAFNHDEAVRSFTRAAELDPGCAMAWWGVAWCQGPNYNDPDMTGPRSEAAWAALQSALAVIDGASPSERALIEALAARYALPAPEDRAALELAYADAMAAVYAAHPDDADIATLYAESLMMLNPWDLYSIDHEPRERTGRIVEVLEAATALDPANPGANHLYIHAVEPSTTPDRGIAAAGRLADSVPGAGHLEHMPSHIYVQTGMWDEAVVCNQKAMSADAAYRERSPEQGLQYMYMTHNSHMLAFAGMMSGREEDALAAARRMWADIPPDKIAMFGPFLDGWMGASYDVLKRFGRWDELLAVDAPPENMPITTANWRSARAVSFAAKKDFDAARAEHAAFREILGSIPEDQELGSDLVHTVLGVADHFIAAEIALQSGDLDTAAAELLIAGELEDQLSYGEPPTWMQPTRHTLGAVYLAAGRFEDAEQVYREDLGKWRGNGWSLYGLARALEGQGELEAAQAARAEFALAWEHADEPTETSCKCIPKT